MPYVLRGFTIAAYGLLLWLAGLWLAWMLLAKADFLYPAAYRLLDIPATLNTYVPQNRHGRQDFVRTDEAEHARLFAAIVNAIRHEGAGLDELTYRDPQGHELGRLLTMEEITHLQDVAHLVTQGERLGLGAALSWLGLMVWMRFKRFAPPRLGPLLLVSLSLVVVVFGVLLLLGPEEVFYAWHRWIFPPEHPWFFYYQDSLMSSLMQAPNLFGFIAVIWLGASLGLLVALHALVRLGGRELMPERSA